MMNLGIFELIPPGSDLSSCFPYSLNATVASVQLLQQGLSKTFAASHLQFYEGYLPGSRRVQEHFAPFSS